jgi:hypothetical protein
MKKRLKVTSMEEFGFLDQMERTIYCPNSKE